MARGGGTSACALALTTLAAVALDNKLFLSSPEAQLVLDRAWLGRAVHIVGEDDGDMVFGALHESAVAEVDTGPLARLAAARREQPHLKRWRFVWPLVAALFLPLVALVPPQLLNEAVFTSLYSPAERYWSAALLYCAFVIIVYHLDACEENCTAGVALDAVLGFWVIALFSVELQAAWQVASAQIQLGRPFIAAICHLHAFNPWKRLDLLGVLMAVAEGATRLASRTSGTTAPEASVRAVATLLLWMRLLTVLSVHWATGPLLASLRRMVISDVSRYVVFQVLAIVTHAAAFVALYSGEDTPAGQYLGDPLSAVMTLCEQTLPIGDPRCGPIWMVINQSGHNDLGWAITGSFGVFSILLLLNLLIGMLGHSYDRVKNQAEMEYAHGRAREVLHAAALPVVPAPLNLLQLPGAAVYFVCYRLLFCHERSGLTGMLHRQSSCEASVYGANAPGAPIDRKQRKKLFTRAWEEIGWQAGDADSWQSSISKQLAQAEKREQQIMARLDAQDALLRRILDARTGGAAPAEAAAIEHAAAPLSPARQSVQVSFPRYLSPSARIHTAM